MATRVFYVVYIGEPLLQASLDILRFVANPDEKWRAHVTVRGPYEVEDQLDPEIFMVEGEEVVAEEVGTFFSEGQNTVFLKCQSEMLRRIWHKPNYGFTPHLTIYDGPSREFAKRLVAIMSQVPFRLSFQATGLSRLISAKGSKENRLGDTIDGLGVAWLLREPITAHELRGLEPPERLDLIERIWKEVLRSFGEGGGDAWASEYLFTRLQMPSVTREDSSGTHRDLRRLAAKAYIEVHGTLSVDRLIADPEANTRFVTRCWQLGATVSEYDLNRALLQSRKRGELGAMPTVERYVVSSDSLDNYLWGVEVALRLLQDEEQLTRQVYVSVDRILCDPGLSSRFDQLVRAIIPGRPAVDYRWASLVIRKHRERWKDQQLPDLPLLDAGLFREVVASQWVGVSGVYAVHREGQCLFVGQGGDLGMQFARLAGLRLQELPYVRRPLSAEMRDARLTIWRYNGSSVSNREGVRREFIDTWHPALNLRVERIGA